MAFPSAGETWNGPHATGAKRAVLSLVGNEFWLAGKPSRASADGKTWRDLPATVPLGQVTASDKGTHTLVTGGAVRKVTLEKP